MTALARGQSIVTADRDGGAFSGKGEDGEDKGERSDPYEFEDFTNVDTSIPSKARVMRAFRDFNVHRLIVETYENCLSNPDKGFPFGPEYGLDSSSFLHFEDLA